MVEYIPMSSSRAPGVERSVLAVLRRRLRRGRSSSRQEGQRRCARGAGINPALAPFKAAILPLSKKEVLTGPAQELYAELSKEFMVNMMRPAPSASAIAARTEIGTPFCITLTSARRRRREHARRPLRDRARATVYLAGARMPTSEVKAYLREKCAFWRSSCRTLWHI